MMKKTPPRWVWLSGILLTIGTLPLVLCLVWEMTLLTWRNGPQMIGFSLMHASAELFILGALFWIGDVVWWLGVFFMAIFRRVALAGTNWLALATVGVILVCPFVPYGVWQGLTASVLGLSPASKDILVQLAAEGSIFGAKTLLGKGIDANVFGGNGCTPLVAAAYGKHTAMVTLLLRRGAKGR